MVHLSHHFQTYIIYFAHILKLSYARTLNAVNSWYGMTEHSLDEMFLIRYKEIFHSCVSVCITKKTLFYYKPMSSPSRE